MSNVRQDAALHFVNVTYTEGDSTKNRLRASLYRWELVLPANRNRLELCAIDETRSDLVYQSSRPVHHERRYLPSR